MLNQISFLGKWYSESEKYEIEACKIIKQKFNVELTSFNKTNKFDFVTSDNISYEVKAYLKSVKTNNFLSNVKDTISNQELKQVKQVFI